MGHGAAGPAWAAWIEHSALGQAMRGSLWLFPLVETLHILGFALLVGAVATFDLRLVAGRVGPERRSWERAVLPVARAGFLIAAPMGLLLFATEATAYARNPAFRLKLVVVALALANVVLFHRLARRQEGVGAALRLAAGLSLALWLLALVLGRLIAYV